MTVLVPYAESSEATTLPIVRAVLGSYEQYERVTHYARLEDPDAYRRLLRQTWQIKETTVVVEHDVLPWPGAIEELLWCPCLWGTYSYHYDGGVGIAHMLGCAKLTSHLMARLPDIWEEPGDWHTLDQRLFFAARKVGIEPHLHRPPVIHLRLPESS